MTPLVLALPWLAILLYARFVTRIPSELPASPVASAPDREQPSVSVIVPARNEAVNIVNCVSSLTRSTYPDFEIIVVDDRSDDATGELARSVPAGNARAIQVIDGAELPADWLGKPWACHQGARVATGDLLLFTDADTTHGPPLLARAVTALQEEEADLLTVVGRQLMESFWERLIQPHIFFLMLLRFPDFERAARGGNWRDAIANGQFMLFPRSAYEALGGHEVVKDEVAEDLAMAQTVKRTGRRLRIRSAEDDLSTRMYRSLAHLVEGWSKNIVTGGLQSFPPWVRPVIPTLSFVSGIVLWIVPPLVFIGTVAVVLLESEASGLGSRLAAQAVLVQSGTVVSLSVLTWCWFTAKMRGPAKYGLLYPLAAAVTGYIFLRSWIRGRDVEWKGRRYRLRPLSERP
jgi:chlorobactene glucosyltransferase